MKKLSKNIKKYLPILFFFLRYVNSKNPLKIIKRKKHKLICEANELERINLVSEIMKTVFNDIYVVQNGPFKGMKYIKKSLGSAFLPKILGSYEEPIQLWIQEVIENKKYKNILNIGAAEGYYACGFAMRLPNVTLFAYDTDKEARNSLENLRDINKLYNIVINSECTHECLSHKSDSNTLIFCDIEGFEKELLDPIKVPNLKFVDIIVEAHDCYVPNVTEELIKRFYLTHTATIIVDYPFRIGKYSTPSIASDQQINLIYNEYRPQYMNFIYLKSIYE